MAKKKNSYNSKEFIQHARAIGAEFNSSKHNPFEFLAKNSISSPLIILGADALRARRLVEWLHSNFFGGAEKTLKTNYNAAELNNLAAIKSIASSFQSMSLFTSYKICLINHVDTLRAAPARELIKLIESSAKVAFIILSSEKSELKGPIGDLIKTSCRIEFTPLSQVELQQWINKEGKRLGLGALDKEACKLLAAQYGDNLLELLNVLERISLYFSHEQPVSAKQINAIISIHHEKSESELMSAIARKDVMHSILFVRNLLEQGLHPLQINAILIRYFRTMLEMKLTPNEVSQKWFTRRVSPYAQYFTVAEIVGCLRNLAQLDLELKGSRLREDLLVELAMRRLALRDTAKNLSHAA